MFTEATRNLTRIPGPHPVSADDEQEITRRAQRAVWCVLALIGSVEVLFGMWLLRLLTRV